MKNLVKFLVPAAVAALALVSCNKEDNYPNAVTIRVHASADELNADNLDSKTYIGDYTDPTTSVVTPNTVLWGTGEYMQLALTAGESTSFVESTDASANLFNGEPEAMFEFSVTPGSASEYVYQGLYPASAAVATSNTNAANYKVNLPAIQNATASSYDPAAYIMVAKPETFTSVQTDWEASFRRGTALNKITLKNVPSGVSFNKVKITAEGKKLAGGRHFNLTTGEGLEVYATDAATIEVLYATAITGTNVDVWFTSWDAEIAEGGKLTIVAYTTDNKSYTKEITVPAGKTIKFQEGYLNTLGANMSGITAEDVKAIENGTYLVLARKGSAEPYEYFAMKGEANGTRIAHEAYTGDLTSYKGNAALVWTINASGSSYTFMNGSSYLGWNGGTGSAANNAALIDYDADKCLMSIDDNGNGTYKVTNTNTPARYLAKNTSSAWFAFYESSGQYGDIVFVPATALETVATPTFSPAAGAVASGTEVTISTTTAGATIHYTVDGNDPTTSSATYSSPIEITATTTIKAIAVKDGMADSEVASATYTVQGAGSEWELVSDFSTIADGGEYIFVNVQNSTSYYMNTATCNQGAGTGCVALTILPTESGFVASDNMILVLSGSADSFVASNKEGKQLKIGATNNGLAINADSGTSLTFYTDANVSGYTLKGYDTASPAVLRYIGMNSTTNFRCYNSVNTNVKTGEYVWYHHIGTGSSTSVTWELKSISVTTAPAKTTYTAGETFDPAGMVVTGHFEDASDSNNTKDEAVTGYTVSPDGALAVTDDHVTITYQGKTTTQAITVNAAPVVTYDFETVAELNALVTSTSATYSGYLTDAIVSFVPQSNTAIVKDATGSVMFYKSGHGLKQGQTYTGAIEVTAIQYNSLYSEVTDWDASFTGAEAVVSPANITLAVLNGNFSTYQNAYVKAEGLEVTAVSGKNVTVSDGDSHTYVVFTNYANATCEVGDIITAIGTVTKYNSTEEIKVWKEADFTVTAGAPKVVTFTQPSQTGCSIAVSVGGSPITSGTAVASGTTVTLTATVGSDYNFGSWGVDGATVVDASATTTTFVMGTSAVTVSASFTSKEGGDPTLQYTLNGTETASGSAYDSGHDLTQNGIIWNVAGNVTMNPWRIGGKNLSGVDRTVYSKNPIAANISSIKITHGAASNITVNSMTVIVASNSNFSTVISTLTPTFTANGTVTVDRPSGVNWSNCYYKIVYNVSVTGSSNRFIQFTGAEFWGTN